MQLCFKLEFSHVVAAVVFTITKIQLECRSTIAYSVKLNTV